MPTIIVGRRMHHQQRPSQISIRAAWSWLREIAYEVAADGEAPAGDLDRRFALVLECRQGVGEQMKRVGRVERRADRGHGHRIGDRRCRRQDCRAAEAVADQQLGRRRAIPQGIGSGQQILDVRSEGRARELAGTGTQPGEIEAQGGNSQLGEAGASCAAARTSLPQVKQWANRA